MLTVRLGILHATAFCQSWVAGRGRNLLQESKELPMLLMQADEPAVSKQAVAKQG
jgi:hypothetical protein